jgi:hypothetical protein
VRQVLGLADVKWEEFVTEPHLGQYAFGRVNWEPKSDPALYVRIPPQLLNKDAENTNSPLFGSISQNLASAGGASPLGGGRDRESEST